MTGRAARRDHHGIAQRRPVTQINGDDLFSLVVFQRGFDAPQKIGVRRGFARTRSSFLWLGFGKLGFCGLFDGRLCRFLGGFFGGSFFGALLGCGFFDGFFGGTQGFFLRLQGEFSMA
jgi:hypothetical protein